MVLAFRGNAFRNPGGLVAWLGAQRGGVRLRPDHKLAIAREMEVTERIKTAREVLRALNRISNQAAAA